MALVHFEVAYHLNSRPDKTHVIRLLTSDEPGSVDSYLVRTHGRATSFSTTLNRRSPAPSASAPAATAAAPESSTRTSRVRSTPAALDKSLWRQL